MRYWRCGQESRRLIRKGIVYILYRNIVERNGAKYTFNGYWLFLLAVIFFMWELHACIRRCVMVSLAAERQEKSIFVDVDVDDVTWP